LFAIEKFILGEFDIDHFTNSSSFSFSWAYKSKTNWIWWEYLISMFSSFMRMFRVLLFFINWFTLVGGVINTPASPSALVSGLTLESDDQVFEIIHSPNSPVESRHGIVDDNNKNDNDDDDIDANEKASTITESEFTMPHYPFRTRQNSIPSSAFSTFRTALFNGISAE
jgi:hypothetical protein